MRAKLLITLMLATTLVSSCGGEDDSSAGPGPAEVTFVFRLHGLPASEEFFIRTSSEEFINQARAQLKLPESQRLMFPLGPIAAGNGGYNYNWSWHYTSAEFAEMAIELCDGRPSMIEEDLTYWLNTVGSFCPWSGYVYRELDE